LAGHAAAIVMLIGCPVARAARASIMTDRLCPATSIWEMTDWAVPNRRARSAWDRSAALRALQAFVGQVERELGLDGRGVVLSALLSGHRSEVGVADLAPQDGLHECCLSFALCLAGPEDFPPLSGHVTADQPALSGFGREGN
jgi:hypothetical protein